MPLVTPVSRQVVPTMGVLRFPIFRWPMIPIDRRRHAVQLTAAGRAVCADLRSAGDTIQAELLDGLDDHEQAALHRLLLRLFEENQSRATRSR